MRSVGNEYEFVNNADGHQYLNWGSELARGNKVDPNAPDAFAFQEANMWWGDLYPKMYDWEWSILDPEIYGFDMISLRGKTDESTWLGLDNALAYWRHWKEDVRRDSSMSYNQVGIEAEWLMNHYMREDVFNMWAPENHSILPGDWVWFYLETTPWDNEYCGRVLQKELEDNVMKLSIGLFIGWPWW